MKVALGSDHRGYAAKACIRDLLTEMGEEVVDFGTDSLIIRRTSQLRRTLAVTECARANEINVRTLRHWEQGRHTSKSSTSRICMRGMRARNCGQHFRAVIVSEMFAGLNRVRAQQLIYAAVQEWRRRKFMRSA